MQTKFFQKFDFVAFIANILAVILGIVITFSIQGVIDKRNEKENVRSALQLVENELKDCRGNFQTFMEYVELNSKAAGYILDHSDDLFSCPKDSLLSCNKILRSTQIITMPSDALELLKTSSLFHAIGNNDLSVTILRTYNMCQAMLQVFSYYENMKSDLDKMIKMNHPSIEDKESDMYINLNKLCKDSEVMSALVSLKVFKLPFSTVTLSEIDQTIDAIEEYLAD